MNNLLKAFNQKPLLYSLLIAFVLRTLAAFFNYGPGAIDDFVHVIDKALQYIQTGEDFTLTSYRFKILPYFFYTLMLPAHWLGIDSPRYLVSTAYFFLGLISLLQILAVHKIGSNILTEKWRNLATLISAIHFLSPFYSTRAYFATFSMLALSWAFYFITKPERKNLDLFWFGFLIAASVFFRFSLAPIYFTLLIFILFREKNFKWLVSYLAGGAAIAVLMVINEIAFGKYPFETVLSFLEYNYNSHIAKTEYDKMGYFNYFGILMYLFIPPLSILFLFPLFEAIKKLHYFTLTLVTFLVVHSLIAFKLDRYVIPMIPIWIIMTLYGFMIVESREYQSFFWKK